MLRKSRRLFILFAALVMFFYISTTVASAAVINHAPVAVDDHYTIIAGQTLVITPLDLLSNDFDEDGDTLIPSDIIPPIDNSKGTLWCDFWGNLTFTPNAGASGDVTFSYQVYDGIAASANYATVTITIAHSVTFVTNGGSNIPAKVIGHNDILPIPTEPTRSNYSFAGWYIDSMLTSPYDFNVAVTNDLVLYAKWIPNPHPNNNAPVAVDDHYTVISGQTLVITQLDLLSNDFDADGDTLIPSDIIPPIDSSKGALWCDFLGNLIFNADAGASGDVTFSYQIYDGAATSANYAIVTISIDIA